MKKLGKSILTFSLGAAAGAVAGLFLVPSSFTQARRAIKNRVNRVIVSEQKEDSKNKLVDLSKNKFEKRGIEDYMYHS